MTTLAEANKTITITPKYMEMKKGDKERVYFVGWGLPMTKLDKQGNLISNPVAVFYREGQIYQNAGAQLVRQLANVKIGTPIEVELTDEKANKSSDGRTKIYSVSILDADPITPPAGVESLAAPASAPQLAAPDDDEHEPENHHAAAPLDDPNSQASIALRRQFAELYQQAIKAGIEVKPISPTISIEALRERIARLDADLKF